MADIAQAFGNYGTPEQRERAQQVASFHSSMKDSDASYQPVSDSSWQTVPAMQMQSAQQASAVQQPRSPIQNVAYQQAAAVQQPGMPVMAETQVAQKVIDPRMAAKEEAANLEAISAQRAQFQAEEEQSRIRAIGYDKLSKEMEAKQADFNNLMAELKSQKLTDPQEKWGTAGKIGAAISMALGAFAAAYTGGRNYAADIIDGAIKRDIDMQEAQIRKLGTDAQGAQNALATAYRKLGDMAQARNAVEMAAIANVSDDIMKRAEKSDNDKVKANAQLAVASLKQKEAQRASAQNEMTIATMGRPMTAGSGKAMTEFEGKAYAGAERMAQAEAQLASLDSETTGVMSKAGTIESWKPERFKSEERKTYERARLNFEQAYDRVMSGANISDGEIQRTLEAAFPKAGDSQSKLRPQDSTEKLY